MASVRRLNWIGVRDYLASEAADEVRHEYVGGTIHAMVGATARHSRVALNLATRINAHLIGSGCQTFVSDLKVRAAVHGLDAFYYPDVVVTCAPIAPDATYLSEPLLIAEVLSESTEGRNRLEKWTAFGSTPPASKVFGVNSCIVTSSGAEYCASMVKLLRIEFPGAFYHITSRG